MGVLPYFGTLNRPYSPHLWVLPVAAARSSAGNVRWQITSSAAYYAISPPQVSTIAPHIDVDPPFFGAVR